jgi:hypothetical protein
MSYKNGPSSSQLPVSDAFASSLSGHRLPRQNGIKRIRMGPVTQKEESNV